MWVCVCIYTDSTYTSWQNEMKPWWASVELKKRQPTCSQGIVQDNLESTVTLLLSLLLLQLKSRLEDESHTSCMEKMWFSLRLNIYNMTNEVGVIWNVSSWVPDGLLSTTCCKSYSCRVNLSTRNTDLTSLNCSKTEEKKSMCVWITSIHSAFHRHFASRVVLQIWGE